MTTLGEYMQAGGHEPLDVFVPADGWRLGIRDASGVVGRVTDGERTTIDYEGNLYGASNIVTFCDRVMIAAGRHIERSPTIARAYVVPDALIRVGSYDGETVELDHPSMREVVCRWLGCDDDQLDDELRPGVPAWTTR